jgi:hypothetical protein
VEHASTPGSDPDDDVLGTASAEPPPPLVEYAFEPDTPMGQVDSLGNFARSLGPRRVKIALFAVGTVAVVLAFLSAIS